ncbi:hypothetical protein CYMTET_45880 [Cymbomonas tetramitiformis]|uniref:CobW C-terminal domain-containing protein n=1 Tax=Cymbomonas tetramitiformis TaxID=36881 RepID=A0AAE0EXV2_9CHLO|nr:hypothetical protein CYMTET_45880 [Cymbomonas tetramitiformis]
MRVTEGARGAGHGHGHAHVHDDSVTSISLVRKGELDLDKVNNWLGESRLPLPISSGELARRNTLTLSHWRDPSGLLLETRSEDLYRMKGVLAIAGCDERFVFQGVHSLFEGVPDRPWGDEERVSKLVFIGKDLPKKEIEESFDTCFV